jgi:nucleoside 2-deoxyribosyltransferase
MFCGQAKHPDTPFEFVDMSVKEPWDEKWKTNCRSRIKGCDGVIVLVTKNTAKAAGAMWEIQCAKDEGKPVLGIYCTTDDRPSSSPGGIKVVNWTWDNVKSFIDSL